MSQHKSKQLATNRYRQFSGRPVLLKLLYIAALFLCASCGKTESNSSKSEVIPNETIKTSKLTDKTVKFLWRDSTGAMVINEEFCKTISNPEKAALGYVATFIGNECWWEGDYTDKR